MALEVPGMRGVPFHMTHTRQGGRTRPLAVVGLLVALTAGTSACSGSSSSGHAGSSASGSAGPSASMLADPSPSATPASASPTPSTSSPTPATGSSTSKATEHGTAPTAVSEPLAAGGCSASAAVYNWTDQSVKGKSFTGWNNGGLGDYYADQDMWGAQGYNVSQHMVVCSDNSWWVTATADNSSGNGAVKTYPNIHRDYHNWSTGAEPKISSFSHMTSAFAATSPRQGIYDVAYDIWLNGVADAGSTEVMIWTENYKQTPAGSKAATVSLGGRTYAVWKTSDSKYIAFVPTQTFTSGTVDLLATFRW